MIKHYSLKIRLFLSIIILVLMVAPLVSNNNFATVKMGNICYVDRGSVISDGRYIETIFKTQILYAPTLVVPNTDIHHNSLTQSFKVFYNTKLPDCFTPIANRNSPT